MLEKFFKLKNKQKSNKGFTLIELLVVVAIIGILSSVVLASLNSAREKSKIALIKSTLKQLYNQAQMNFTENGSFINSNPSYTDLTCTGPGNNLGKIVQPLIDQGIIVKCFSFYGTGLGGVFAGDNYLRFGATALIYDAGELKAWSVDENGVVKWDTWGVNSDGTNRATDAVLSWTTARDACAKNGGRLPSLEQLRALSWAWYSSSLVSTGTGSYNPTGFYTPANWYWSSIVVPSTPSSSYYVRMIDGGLNSTALGQFTRCVR